MMETTKENNVITVLGIVGVQKLKAEKKLPEHVKMFGCLDLTVSSVVCFFCLFSSIHYFSDNLKQ